MSTISRSGAPVMPLALKRTSPEQQYTMSDPPQPQRRSLRNMPRHPDQLSTSSGSDSELSTLLSISLGCRVAIPSMDVTGTLRFLGPADFKPGLWAGIELDAFGTGKNDGSVQGIRYFTCPPETGLFILASKIVSIEEPTQPMQSRSNRTSAPALSKTRLQPDLSPSTRSARSSTTPTKSMRATMTPTKSSRMSISSTKSTRASMTPTKSARASMTPTKSTRASITPSKSTKASMTPTKSTRASITPNRRTPVPGQVSANDTGSRRSTRQKMSPPPLPEPSADPILELEKELAAAERRSKTFEDELEQNNKKLNHMYDLLEQAERDNGRLSQQMKDNEMALEGLVSTKESYKLRAEEHMEEIRRLRTELDSLRQDEDVLRQVVAQHEASLARSNQGDEELALSQRRVIQLEKLVRELQSKNEDLQKQMDATIKEHHAQMDQLHHELRVREEQAASLEKESDEHHSAYVKAADAYDDLLEDMRTKEQAWHEKTREMRKLEIEAEALRRQLASGDVDLQEKSIYDDEWSRQRLRLEQQLESTTDELDRERQQIGSMRKDMEGLRGEIQRLQGTLQDSNKRFDTLQQQLDQEVADKRRLIEEADVASEAQAHAEDELMTIKMELEQLQEQLTSTDLSDADVLSERQQEHIQALEARAEKAERAKQELEQECSRLMDDMVAMEKADVGGTNKDERTLRVENEKLKHELEQMSRRYADMEIVKRTESNRLHDELAKLTTMVENNVFHQGDLEDALEAEKTKVKALEAQVADYERAKRRTPPPRSMGSSDVYCELCEEYGHDVISCTAYLHHAGMTSVDDLVGSHR